jgi:hypothetical protein
MRITKLCLSVLLLIAASFPSICQSRSLEIKDIQGSWTRQKYVEAVRSTRSPFAESPETVTIKDDKFSWTNYHEGAWRKIVRIEEDKVKGVYRLVLGPWEKDPPGTELIEAPFKTAINRNGKIETMTFLTDAAVHYKQEPFLNVSEPLEQLIARIVLTGAYRDQQGQSYVFDKSGIAIWPGSSFSYEVALDHIEATCDYFLVDYHNNPVNTKAYGFKWVGNKMELFNNKSKDGLMQCEDQPFTILTPQM